MSHLILNLQLPTHLNIVPNIELLLYSMLSLEYFSSNLQIKIAQGSIWMNEDK